MIEKNYRAIYMKMYREGDDLLDFVMTHEGTTNQTKAIFLALKAYKENVEILKALRELVSEQKKANQIMTDFYVRGGK
jgi:hemoglobin-like flavoprotein